MVDVNQCLEGKKSSDILSVLKSSTSNANDIIPECADKYHDALVKAKELKSERGKLVCYFSANYFKYHFCDIIFS